MTGPDAEEPGFEATLAALEERVRRIEAGELPLEEALALYEEGVSLAERCHAQLAAAEERVTRVRRGAHGIEDEPVRDVD